MKCHKWARQRAVESPWLGKSAQGVTQVTQIQLFPVFPIKSVHDKRTGKQYTFVTCVTNNVMQESVVARLATYKYFDKIIFAVRSIEGQEI